MNTTVYTLIFCVVFVICTHGTLAEEDKYPAKYDDIDIEEILNNKRLLHAYGDCLLDKGPCTQEGTSLKEALPDALTNKCSKCSEKQKKGIKIVLKHLIEKENELFKKLEAKYDPEGNYKKQYKELAEKEGITV